jgi:tetratricopeptide (TPR) repeat protein/predicted Ser/Thr protein kinase
MIAPPGRKLGKYEIRQKLGRGGMADVYLAQDTEQGQFVALKLIEHSPDADTRDFMDAERRGAELQAKLAAIDPRVVRVYDYGDLDGFFYVAMEYIDGQDLAELTRRGPLTPEFAAEVAWNVAQTLDHAHHLSVEIEGKVFQGIVHGDIKPKNIRIDARGNVRVLDFGIAKALSLSRRLTRNEFGSVPYASPERLDRGEVSVDSDIWSVGVMLYEMATGLQPYQAETTERLERMIRSRVPPPPAPDPCPEPLRRILMKALAPEPGLRYRTARELAEDLEAFRRGEPVQAAHLDLDATRRTARSDETRRTAWDQAPEGATRRTAGANAPPPAAPPRSGKGIFRFAGRLLAAMLLAGLVYSVWAGISSYLLYRRGQALERQIATEQITDPNEVWQKWTELSRSNPSSFLLRGPRKLVKQKLVAAVDHVIDTYRNSDTVYEKQWAYARDMAARALAVDPDDTVRGKLRLAEGHLARINGTVHRDAANLNLAVEKFNEARRLMPRSPDPLLGLARVYVYGLKDIDRAYQALQDAQKLGFAIGNREKAQLADGYRDRADRLFWDSRNVRGLPQEKDEILRAKDDYSRALELYQEVAPYGNSNANIVRVEASLDSVNFRLNEIERGNSPAGILKQFLHIWQ